MRRRHVPLRGRGRGAADRGRLRAASGRHGRRGGARAGGRRCSTRAESNNFAHIEFENGDVDGAFAHADRVFTKRFHHGRFHALPLEGRALLADWNAGSGELTLWTSSQIPHLRPHAPLAHARAHGEAGQGHLARRRRRLRAEAPSLPGGRPRRARLEAARPAGEVDRGPVRGARGEPPREGDHLRADDRDEGRRHVRRHEGSLRRATPAPTPPTRSRRSSIRSAPP